MKRVLFSVAFSFVTICWPHESLAQNAAARSDTDTTKETHKMPDDITVTGILRRNGKNFELVTKDQVIYRIVCTAEEGEKYLGLRVKIQGQLLQGYDSDRYGNINLPIEQIAPEDILYIITGTHISRQ